MKPLTNEQIEGHRLASLDAIDDEFCRRAAFKIAKKSARRGDAVTVSFRYRRIAQALYLHRRRPLSKKRMQQAARSFDKYALQPAQGGEAETRKEATLWKSLGKPALKPEEMKVIERELCALRKTVEKRALVPLIRRQMANGSWPTKADRLLRQWQRDGKAKVFCDLERAIRRYLLARENGEKWVAGANFFSLLHLLALEWLRDPEALWSFLETFMQRCSLTASDPYCELRRRIAIHQNAPTTGHDTFILQKGLEKCGLLENADVADAKVSVSQRDLIKKHISRDVSRARAKRARMRVTK